MPETCRSPPPPLPVGLPTDAEALPRAGLLFIDWECGFCHRSRAWLERHARPGRLLSGGLQSDVAAGWSERCGLDATRRDTVVLVDVRKGRVRCATHSTAMLRDTVVLVDVRKGRVRCATHSTAMLRAMRALRWPYRALLVLWVVPRPLRDWGYRWVARHRHRL